MDMEFLDSFRKIQQACYGQVEQRLSKYGLVKGQAELLILIKDNDGCAQRDLANLVGVRYSSMSERLNKLEMSGYIARNTDSENSKYKRVSITPEGKTAVAQCRRILNNFDEVLYKGITKKDIAGLQACLDKMVNNLDKLKTD